MSNTVFIIGNGLNYLIKHIIDSNTISELEATRVLRRPALSKNIGEITILWKKFDDAFDDLRQNFLKNKVKISDEELIKLISSVISFFSNLNGFEKVISKEDIDKLHQVLDGFLLQKIIDIAEEFMAHEAKRSYSSIREYFKDFQSEFDRIVDKHRRRKVLFFTTNYDGILDVLLSKPKGGFVAPDGFTLIEGADGGSPEARIAHHALKFLPKILNDKKYVMCHIHGSYKFIKYFGRTYKLRGRIKNVRPVIVFNKPEAKADIIASDTVLSEYMKFFITSLQNPETTRLVILGNSMEAEPHLKEAIRDYYSPKSSKKDIILVSREPEKIGIQLKDYYAGELKSISVSGVDSNQDLINLFDKILDPTT